jgi:DNA-binding CsgD family transcriptional regulator/PAS domain-containing protein
MLRDEGQVNRLIGRIYEAALSPARWNGVLDELRGALNGAAFQIYTIDSETKDVVQQWDCGLPRRFTDEYRAHYSKLSERNDLLLRIPGLSVIYDRMFFEEAEMDRSEMYRWRAGFDFRYFIGAQLLRTDSTLSMAALQRSKRQGHATQLEIGAFAAFRPHLSRALRIQGRLAALEQENSSTWAAIEDASFGIVVLTGERRIWRCNREAERIMAEGGEIGGQGGKLIARRPIDDAALQRLIAGAIETAHGRGGGVGSGGSMALAKRSSPRPYAVLVAPVPEPPPPLSLAGPAAVVLLTDPDHAPETPAQLLRRVYGLTRKEAQLALALAGGATLADAAEGLRIAEGTARRHLAAIFARTGIHRQAELVRLILSLPPMRPN